MQDQQLLNSRISAMANEQREVKIHWLAEKNDLQARFFQIQSLNTQMQGTLKKKEKDFEKLQAHLAKLVKEASRGQKSTLQRSQPLRKNLSQDSAQDPSSKMIGNILRDAEVNALKNTIQNLNVRGF